MSLKFLFEPEAIALIGASNNPAKVGRQILENLSASGWRGPLYPINLKEKKISGRRAYGSLADLPVVRLSSLLVIIAIPAFFVVAEVEKAARLGAKNFVIISSGFRESGVAGRRAEQRLKNLAGQYRLNILGPNCLGLINSAGRLNATFSAANRRPGRIALVSQSGAIGAALLDWLKQKNLNLAYFVSLGNKAVLDETDILAYLQADKQIEIFVFYLEEIGRGQRLMALISRLVKERPVIILKSGRSTAAKKLAQSHTGALAGASAIVRVGLERAGAVYLENLEELFNFLLLFKKTVRLAGHSSILDIITNAGGPAVLAVDEISRQGLSVGTSRDLLGDADAARYQQAINQALARPSVRSLLVLLTPQTMTEPLPVGQALIRAAHRYPHKLVMASFIGGAAIQPAKELLLKNNLPFFDYPESAVKALAKLAAYHRSAGKLKPYVLKTTVLKTALRTASSPDPFRSERSILRSLGADEEEIRQYQVASPARRRFLGDYQRSLAKLKRAGFDVVRTEKYSPAKKYSGPYPAVLKIVGPDFLHKTEQGAVVTGLASAADLRRTAVHLRHRHRRALTDSRNYLVVQAQISGGLEMIIGFKQDPSFGPMILVGLGGIYAEVFRETKLVSADLDINRARAVLRELIFYPLLNGARGRRPYAVNALASVLVKLSRFANQHPGIKELDINPLFVGESRVIAGDVRLIV
jgi:acetyltransferase